MPPAQRKPTLDLDALKSPDAEPDNLLEQRVDALSLTVSTLEELFQENRAALRRLQRSLNVVLNVVYGTGVRPALPEDEEKTGGDNT